MEDKYINDRLNFLLLRIKQREFPLSRKENRELKRLEKRGLNVGESKVEDYLNILLKKQYLTLKRTVNLKVTTDEYFITEIGQKALKYEHLKS